MKQYATNFIDSVLTALKKKFIAENSYLKQAGIIFLLGKLYFTDDIAIGLKLRTTGEEWMSFKAFLNDIKDDVQYQDISLMLYHLYTESFFRFTIKSKRLALDYGTPENVNEDMMDPTKSIVFWKDIQEDLIKMQYTDVAELKQLAEIRDEALKPFDDLLPEKVSINEALDSFETIKDTVSKLIIGSPKKASRKVIIQTCREYMNQSHHDDRNLAGDSDVDYESVLTTALSKTSKKKNKKANSNTESKKKRKEKSKKSQRGDEGDESENEYKQLTRRLGFTSQRVMQGIGVFGACSEKLKKCYE